MIYTKNIFNDEPEKSRIETDGPSIVLVTEGRKVIIDGPTMIVVTAGNMVYLPAGVHHFEPEPHKEIVVEFAPGESARLFSLLSEHLGMVVDEHNPCDECRDNKYVKFPAWPAMTEQFASMRKPAESNVIEQLKKMELITMLAENPKCCIQQCLLRDSDPHTENFEKIIRENIFRSLSLKELAALTNRSTTAFKAEFKRRFHEPPHTYMNRQRLAHARMLLITTSRPVATIGEECKFNNPSHFIKLFGKEYGMTPAAYRKRHERE